MVDDEESAGGCTTSEERGDRLARGGRQGLHGCHEVTKISFDLSKRKTDVVFRVLLQCGADLDSQDIDGWTPLHAAAHWGHKDACQILAENFSDMDAKNYVVRMIATRIFFD
jgi:ankyrin repeat protein